MTSKIDLVKPFLKWAGGKTQLLEEIEKSLPESELLNGKITKYVEPFVGSGAVMFFILQKYPQIKEAYVWDINPELINVYTVIKENVDSLIELLSKKESEFIPLDQENRKAFYYKVRTEFNESLDNFDFTNYGEHSEIRASQFIFLNRTCFNGLFRVNKQGKFNVPMGNYSNPKICFDENLRAVNKFLQRVEIKLGDYKESKVVIDDSTFVYFDPPYRPLNESSSFTSYSKFDFIDENQIELADYYKDLNLKGSYLMLSNSDPKNVNPEDSFFDDLYSEFNIRRVDARRNINSKGNNRGTIKELLIANYLTNNNN